MKAAEPSKKVKKDEVTPAKRSKSNLSAKSDVKEEVKPAKEAVKV